MSWLNPEKIPPSDYDPHRIVNEMVEKHGSLSGKILEAFNSSDPLHVFYGDNIDEYHGYVERFMRQLGDRDLSTLSDHEVEGLIRGSFHPSQIDKGFIDSKDLTDLVQRVIALRAMRA